MTLETDLLIDRRRLKRRLFVWRVIAIVAVVACVGVAFRLGGGGSIAGIAGAGSHIARVRITGVIGDNRKLVEAIAAVGKDDTARALIVAINSPGGTVGGSEALYIAIGEVAAKKPVVAVMGSVAASGGYMAAIAAPRIFARESTITGSIGVLLSNFEVSGLLGKVGIGTETLTSGPLKAQPSSTSPLTGPGRTVLQALVMDMYDQFVEKVALGRKMDVQKIRELADGRIYTGRQALRVGLIDAIGGETEARAWLVTERGIAAGLPVRDADTKSKFEAVFGETADEFFGDVLKTLFSQRVKLDGAVALWQPFDTN